MLEETAKLVHKTWWMWAKGLMESEDLSNERKERWSKYMIPYEELDEKTKDQDRKIAMMYLCKWKEVEICSLREEGIVSELVFNDMMNIVEEQRNKLNKEDF